MKKILTLALFLSLNNTCFAKMTENVYVVKNVDPTSFSKQLSQKVSNPNIDVNNNILYANDGAFYYFKTYKDNSNLTLFLVCDNGSLDENAMLIRSIGYKFYKLDDKDLKNKYEKDFNAYISGTDVHVKTLGKSNGKSKKYNPYIKPLNNLKLGEIVMEKENITIVRTKYKAKSEVQDFANGYEYSITNNNRTPITLKEVGSSDFVGLTEIAKRVVGTNFSDFVPGYGLVRAIRTDIEKNKFTRPMPTNQTISPGQTTKVLALSYLQKDPTADFIFAINNKEYKFTFKNKKED